MHEWGVEGREGVLAKLYVSCPHWDSSIFHFWLPMGCPRAAKRGAGHSFFSDSVDYVRLHWSSFFTEWKGTVFLRNGVMQKFRDFAHQLQGRFTLAAMHGHQV